MGQGHGEGQVVGGGTLAQPGRESGARGPGLCCPLAGGRSKEAVRPDVGRGVQEGRDRKGAETSRETQTETRDAERETETHIETDAETDAERDRHKDRDRDTAET